MKCYISVQRNLTNLKFLRIANRPTLTRVQDKNEPASAIAWAYSIAKACTFLDGLSLHLNHLIGSRLGNYDWQFGTLPSGLFGSNLDTMDLETYPRTYSGQF